MSLPKHTTSPSLSSSPSRQSIRRTADSNPPSSRPQSIIDRPPTAQQTHHPVESTATQGSPVDNPPSHVQTQALQGDGHHDFPPTPSLHQHQQHPPQQPPFQPFFTLIEDANTSEYYHPTVHYIFSDDDTDIVTEAALRSLESDQDVLSQGGKGKSKPARDHAGTRERGGDDVVYDEEDDEFAIARKDPLLPPPIPGVRDNYIILDMETAVSDETTHQGNAAPNRENNPGSSSGLPAQTHPAGAQSQSQQHQQQPNTPNPPTQTQTQTPTQPPQFTITSAHSLTPSWQVLQTDMIPAPTFETNTSNEPVNGGLMLKIQGTAGLPITQLGKDRDKEHSSQRLEDMMDQFSKRLGELRQVIEAGEQGQFGRERGGAEGRDMDTAADADATTAAETGYGNENIALAVDLEGGVPAPGTAEGMENEGQGV